MSRRPYGERGLILLATAWLLVSSGFAQTNTVLHLKSGDRLVGTIVSEDATNVVITGAWVKNLSIPLEAIARRELLPAGATAAPLATNVVAVAPVAPLKPVAPPAPPPKNWKANFEVGANMIQGAVDRELYWGKLNFTYAQPYKSDPKKFFRTTLDY